MHQPTGRRAPPSAGCCSYPYATSCPLSPPHSRVPGFFPSHPVVPVPNLSETHKNSHTLECPANGEAKRTLRLEIVEAPRIFQQLVERRPDLVEPHIRRQSPRQQSNGQAIRTPYSPPRPRTDPSSG